MTIFAMQNRDDLLAVVAHAFDLAGVPQDKGPYFRLAPKPHDTEKLLVANTDEMPETVRRIYYDLILSQVNAGNAIKITEAS